MGLFDSYVPDQDLKCPACGAQLSDWQGKDGPNALFIWKQGAAAPVDQLVSDDLAIPVEDRNNLRLPTEFTIYSPCCSDRFLVEASCRTASGVWNHTSLVTAENATQNNEERRADFRARVAWLSGNAV